MTTAFKIQTNRLETTNKIGIEIAAINKITIAEIKAARNSRSQHDEIKKNKK
jgi:hypothetical protein